MEGDQLLRISSAFKGYTVTIYEQALSAVCGSIVCSLLITPLDVVKIRLQVQQKTIDYYRNFLACNEDDYCGYPPKNVTKQYILKPGQFGCTFDTFVRVARSEGVTSLWSGLTPTLLIALPSTVIYYVSYEQLRNRLRRYFYPNLGVNEQLPSWIAATTGGISRGLASTVVNPLELVKTNVQSKNNYYEVYLAMTSLYRREGLRGFWTGLLPTLLRDIPFSSISWLCYEKLKYNFQVVTENSTYLAFLSGAISGSIAAVITLPLDVIKTYQQIQFGEGHKPSSKVSMMEQIRMIYNAFGWRGLWTGIGPRILKVAPANAIMLTTFEFGKAYFEELHQSDKKNIRRN